MKSINFNVPEVYRALVDKSKIQTIRKAWTVGDLNTRLWCCPDAPHCDCKKEPILLDKPSRFEIGDKIKLVWNGKFVLGFAKITDVFKILIIKNQPELNFYQIVIEGTGFNVDAVVTKRIAEFDGFSSVEQMFGWLDSHYDLSRKKPFWVYRWEWAKREACLGG